MKHPAYPHCQQDPYVIRSGLNHTDSQRYRCQQCRRYLGWGRSGAFHPLRELEADELDEE
jgi:predicted SprT family Zn-dependent metalloprotease